VHDADAFDQLPPTTPVLIGVGEVSETLGSPDYAARSEAALAADAVRVLDAQEALAAGL
jgi:acetyl-CoA C-acetyltransferase